MGYPPPATLYITRRPPPSSSNSHRRPSAWLSKLLRNPDQPRPEYVGALPAKHRLGATLLLATAFALVHRGTAELIPGTA